MPKTKRELEADLVSAQNTIATLTATANTLTGERDTARAEVTRLTGEVATRDNTITTITRERDEARRGCDRNRRRGNGALLGLGIAALMVIGALIWAFNAQSNVSEAKQVTSLAEQAKLVAEKAAEDAKAAVKTTEAKLAEAEAATKASESKLAEVEKAQAESEAAVKATEAKLAEVETLKRAAETAREVAEKELAEMSMAPSSITGAGSPKIPDGEIRELERLDKKPGGLVCRYIPDKGGMVNGRYVRPLFVDKEGRMVCQVGPGESVEDKVRNLSFEGIPKSQIPDTSKIQVIRTVAYRGQIFHQLGVVE